MTRFLSETPEERRKERDETFSIRMIELSILATTLCGIMISFSYQADPAVIFIFLVSSSFFIASGMGLIFLVLVSRGYFSDTLPVDKIEKLRGWSIMVFFFGMLGFLLGIAAMVVFNIVLYISVVIPILLILIPLMYYLSKYRYKTS